MLRSKVNLKIKLFVFTILRYGLVWYSVSFFIFVSSRHTIFLIILLVRISNLYITLSWLFTYIMLKSLAYRYYHYINRMFSFVNIFYTSEFLKVFRYDHNLYQIICCQSFKCGPFNFRCFLAVDILLMCMNYLSYWFSYLWHTRICRKNVSTLHQTLLEKKIQHILPKQICLYIKVKSFKQSILYTNILFYAPLQAYLMQWV